MSGLFGTRTIHNTTKRLESFRINSSAYGIPIPIVFNTTRISGNIIDYVDFTAIPHTKTQTSGKGGRTQIKNTTYTYTVAVAIGLCEGSVSIGRVWMDKDVKNLSELGLELYYNKVWPYVIGKYDERVVTYKGVSYCAGVCDLGESDMLPALNFEVSGMTAAPVDIVSKLLNDSVYGVGIQSRFIGDLSAFRMYCEALGIQLAVALTSSTAAHEILSDIMKCTNSEFLWSNGQLTIRPYAEQVVSGNGVTYEPDLTIRYNLTDDDFIEKDGDPVEVMRSMSADAYNSIKVEFINRDNEYNTDVAQAQDAADIEQNGLREAETETLHYIHDRNTATSIAYMLLKKHLYVRNRIRFSLSMKYCLLEVFDIVTITDPHLGYDKRAFRIVEITENEDGTSDYEAEECFVGIGYSPIVTGNPNKNIYQDTTTVGNVNPPIIFTAPTALTGGRLEVWMGISGRGKDWGGAQIWRSWDGNSYMHLADIHGPSTTGTLVEDITESSGVITVNVSESGIPLRSVSSTEAAHLVSLCYLDGEFFTFEEAQLIAEHTYKLRYVKRGLFGSKAAHSAGASFLRIDGTITKRQIPHSLIDQQMYIKCPSFDVKGNRIQPLETLPAYTYRATLPGMPQVKDIRLAIESATTLIVTFTMRESTNYMFSEVYYRKGSYGDFVYASMDRQRVVIPGVEAGSTYTVKVLPVAQGNLKGNLATAAAKSITIPL